MTWACTLKHLQRAFLRLGKGLRSPERWDPCFGRAFCWGGTVRLKSKVLGSPGMIKSPLDVVCVCELLEVIYVGINEIIWPN